MGDRRACAADAEATRCQCGATQAARCSLEQAEADARSARADADRYVRCARQEADLLVAKARRVLAAAEAEGRGDHRRRPAA